MWLIDKLRSFRGKEQYHHTSTPIVVDEPYTSGILHSYDRTFNPNEESVEEREYRVEQDALSRKGNLYGN